MLQERRISFTYKIDWPVQNDEQEFRYFGLLDQDEFHDKVRKTVQDMFAKQLQLEIPCFTMVTMTEMDERNL